MSSRRFMKRCLGATAAVLLLLVGTTFAGTPGDTTKDSYTYCNQGQCTRVTITMVLNANHQWEIVSVSEEHWTEVQVSEGPDSEP